MMVVAEKSVGVNVHAMAAEDVLAVPVVLFELP